MSLESQGIIPISLNPWHDAALQQWLEDCDLALTGLTQAHYI